MTYHLVVPVPDTDVSYPDLLPVLLSCKSLVVNSC